MYSCVTSTPRSCLRFFAMCVVLLIGAVKEGYGQRVYATSVSSNSGNGILINNINQAISSDGTTPPSASPPANISVSGAALSPRTAFIQLQFSVSIPQNRTVFLRVASESFGLLGGETIVTALNNNSEILSNFKKFTTTDGWDLYALNVSGGSFNQVRISVTANALSSGSIDVYYAFYEPTTTECATVLGMTTGSTGVLTLGNINSPANTIDGDLDSYSTFSITLGVVGSLNQTVYFSNISNPGEAVTATFSVPDNILSLDLLSNVQIAVYRGDTFVSSQNLNNLLSVDLLGLLNDHERYSVSFVPTDVFDRVVVSMSSTLGVLANLRLHEVQRTPAKPEVPALDTYVLHLCEGETADITAQSMTGSIIRWYDAVNDGQVLQQSSNNTDTYVVGPYPIGTTHLYTAAAWDTDCPAESERVDIEVIVTERPPSPNIILHPDAPY